jgi:hypothetical protein
MFLPTSNTQEIPGAAKDGLAAGLDGPAHRARVGQEAVRGRCRIDHGLAEEADLGLDVLLQWRLLHQVLDRLFEEHELLPKQPEAGVVGPGGVGEPLVLGLGDRAVDLRAEGAGTGGVEGTHHPGGVGSADLQCKSRFRGDRGRSPGEGGNGRQRIQSPDRGLGKPAFRLGQRFGDPAAHPGIDFFPGGGVDRSILRLLRAHLFPGQIERLGIAAVRVSGLVLSSSQKTFSSVGDGVGDVG